MVKPSSWKLSSGKLAEIDGDGLLKVKKSGKVKVTASFKHTGGKTRSLVFSLKIRIPQFKKGTYKLKLKNNKTVTAKTGMKYIPDGATVLYSTEDPAVAAVDETTGKITAVGKGTTQIRALIKGITYTAKIKVKG